LLLKKIVFFPLEKDSPKGTCIEFDQNIGVIENVQLRFIVAGPENRDNHPITKEYTRLIDKSGKDIYIANLLFNPTKQIKERLKNKKEAGVRIFGLFNGTTKEASLHHYVYALPNRSNYELLDKAYEYTGANQLYHKKQATFDGKYTIIGSYNLGIKSAYCDDEIICVIKSKRVTSVVNQQLIRDAQNSQEIDWSSLSKQKHLFIKASGNSAINLIGNFYG
jgi:phosphatidylserine/phosphatidylglycerophosphate/cardiolipin synthase-like enzyme